MAEGEFELSASVVQMQCSVHHIDTHCWFCSKVNEPHDENSSTERTMNTGHASVSMGLTYH